MDIPHGRTWTSWTEGVFMDLNKYDLPKEQKKRLADWKESVPVVVLSDALKIAGRKHGISIYLDDDGRPTLHFNPGLKGKDIGSNRWTIAENVCELFIDAVPDLLLLIANKKIMLPEHNNTKQAGPY